MVQTQRSLAELARKIRQSRRVIAACEKQMLRPRATDDRSLGGVLWSRWNGLGP
jgi:hypothetical protein